LGWGDIKQNCGEAIEEPVVVWPFTATDKECEPFIVRRTLMNVMVFLNCFGGIRTLLLSTLSWFEPLERVGMCRHPTLLFPSFMLTRTRWKNNTHRIISTWEWTRLKTDETRFTTVLSCDGRDVKVDEGTVTATIPVMGLI
jgi:hypothetical protein